MSCGDCINGHVESCDSLEPAYDIGDLISRSGCHGCCPNKCRPSGLQRLQDDCKRQAESLIRSIEDCAVSMAVGGLNDEQRRAMKLARRMEHSKAKHRR